jgi:hypothetical protein
MTLSEFFKKIENAITLNKEQTISMLSLQFRKNIELSTFFKTSALAISALGLVGLESINQKVQAVTTTQTLNFNQSIPISGSLNNGQLLSNNFFSGTVFPFDSNLGTLNSFAVNWNIDVALNATTNSNSGGISLGLGGSLFLDGTNYDGMGNGNGNGAAPNSSFNFTFNTANTRNFLVSNSGVTYNPALLNSVTGNSNFNLLYQSPLSASYSNIDSGTATVTGSATLTYDYQTASVPFEFTPSLGLLTMGGIFGFFCLRKIDQY